MKKFLIIATALCAFAVAAEAKNVTLKLTNNTPNYITNFTVVPADGSAPPVEIVDSGGLASGATITEEILNVPHDCIYDFSISYANGVKEDRKNSNICDHSEVLLK